MGFCPFLGIISWSVWLQMTLRPSYRMDNGKMVKVRASRDAHVAVTQYQVLSSTPSSALVELQPVTGKNHHAASGALYWILPYSELPCCEAVVCRLWVWLTCVTLCFSCRSETRVSVGMMVGSRRIFCILHWPETVILLPQPHKSWNYRKLCRASREHNLNSFI